MELAVSEITTANETRAPTERGNATMHFTLTDEHRAKLASSKYQLRLYCTSSSFHSSAPQSLWATQVCPIEFPPICEIKINAVTLSANTRGMKKKPGTAPPVDLGKHVKLTTLNRIDMTYMNNNTPTSGPFTPKVSFFSSILMLPRQCLIGCSC